MTSQSGTGGASGAAARTPRSLLAGVYALIDPARDPHRPFDVLDGVLAAGIRLVQLRSSRLESALLDAAVARVRSAGGIAIVNDDVEAALRADGVHLGQEDAAGVDLLALRGRLGHRVIGLSCGTPAEARAADAFAIDYLGVGPVFATATKADAGAPIGISGVRAVVAATVLPCAAIGGISAANARRVRESGATMCAAIGAFVSGDPSAAARALIAAWSA